MSGGAVKAQWLCSLYSQPVRVQRPSTGRLSAPTTCAACLITWFKPMGARAHWLKSGAFLVVDDFISKIPRGSHVGK